jgi:hypothetical protein
VNINIDTSMLSEEEMADLFGRVTPFVKYDPETGAVVEHGTIAVGIIQHLMETGQPYLAGKGQFGVHRVVNGVLEEIPLAPATWEGDNLIGLPVPCFVTLAAPNKFVVPYVVPDGVAELELLEEGTWHIKVSAPGYRDNIMTKVVT